MSNPLMPPDPSHHQYMDEADQLWMRSLTETCESPIHPLGFFAVMMFVDPESGKRGWKTYDCLSAPPFEIMGLLEMAKMGLARAIGEELI